jgi:hypothetical protein
MRDMLGTDRANDLKASSAADLSLFSRNAFAPRHRLPQHKLDLSIHAAQVIRRPFLDVLQKIGRDPEQKGLALFRRHGSGVQGAGVDHRRGI